MSEGQPEEPMEILNEIQSDYQQSNLSSSTDHEMEDVSQGSNNQVLYTEGPETSQTSSPPLNGMMLQYTVDQTHLQTGQVPGAQMKQSGQLSNDQDLNQPIVTQPTSINKQYSPVMGHNKDYNAEGADTQDPRQHLDQINTENITTDQTNKSDSQADKDSDYMKHRNSTTDQTNKSDSPAGKNLQASSAKGQGSQSSLDKQMPQDIKMVQRIKSDSQTEKDICNNGYVNTTQSQTPLDIATFKIKVDQTEPFPEKWEKELEKALQRWFNLQVEKNVSVCSIKLMEDPSCAEVQITPSTALETLKKLKTVCLDFKHENKNVPAQIYMDQAHFGTVSQNPRPDKNRIPSSQMNGTKPGTSAASDDTNNGVNAAASNKDPSGTKNPETSDELTVPPYHYWYMVHAYRKDVEKIEKQYGVSMNAEVSVSFKPTHSSSSDSVSKAFDDFQKLFCKCVQSFSEATINHTDMDSDIVKQTLHTIQSEEAKMMFTMSASNCLLFGPKNITDMIKRKTRGVEQQSKGKSNEMDVDKDVSLQNRPSLDMDTNDLPNHLEMKKIYWDLMKLSYKEQISQLETKYSVSFHERNLQNNSTIKVQAKSTGDQHINLESHALRALTHLYQKLALAAVSCELINPTDKTAVAQIVEELQQQHYCVVAVDVFSPWRLFGLPEHLGPAIAHTEKKLQKDVFDYKMKKLIGYSGDIPHARGIKRNQMPDYGQGAVGGVNFRGRGEAETGFNEESKDNSRHDSTGAHAEEEMCAICMDSFNDKEKLKCGHEFCRDCIKRSVNSLGSICPVCKEVFGKLEGNQPNGKMTVTTSGLSLPGYPDCGTIEITYNIPSGIQTEKHPNPGTHYHGANRRAYLPHNNEGKEVLALLQRAFQQKLIFTVGKSTTSGFDNVVTWNDIHHKTSQYGGPESYGYPDPDYLKRVKDELKAKGIE